MFASELTRATGADCGLRLKADVQALQFAVLVPLKVVEKGKKEPETAFKGVPFYHKVGQGDCKAEGEELHSTTFPCMHDFSLTNCQAACSNAAKCVGVTYKDECKGNRGCTLYLDEPESNSTKHDDHEHSELAVNASNLVGECELKPSNRNK